MAKQTKSTGESFLKKRSADDKTYPRTRRFTEAENKARPPTMNSKVNAKYAG